MKTRKAVRDMGRYMRQVNPAMATALIGAAPRLRRRTECKGEACTCKAPVLQRSTPCSMLQTCQRSCCACCAVLCCADERDAHMVRELSRLEGRVVGVVGLAHLDGMERRWEELMYSGKALAPAAVRR